MPAGIQVWDENGVLILDTSFRAGGFLGEINVVYNGPSSGSVYDPNLSEGTPFYFLRGDHEYQPTVTFSGNTVNWAKDMPHGQYWGGTIYYGVY